MAGRTRLHRQWQFEAAAGDDVLLHFGRAAANRVERGSAQGVFPLAIAGGVLNPFVQYTGRAQDIEGGIGQALVCTAAGLCVAIPAYFFHRYFRGRVADYVVDMEEQTIRLIDELSAHAEPAAAPARAAAKAH